MLKMDSTNMFVGLAGVHGQDFKFSPCSSAYLLNEVYYLYFMLYVCFWQLRVDRGCALITSGSGTGLWIV